MNPEVYFVTKPLSVYIHLLFFQLVVGDCFGTLEQLKDREPNSRVLSVKGVDVNCEFLKISCSDYVRVIEVSNDLIHPFLYHRVIDIFRILNTFSDFFSKFSKEFKQKK